MNFKEVQHQSVGLSAGDDHGPGRFRGALPALVPVDGHRRRRGSRPGPLPHHQSTEKSHGHGGLLLRRHHHLLLVAFRLERIDAFSFTKRMVPHAGVTVATGGRSASSTWPCSSRP